jgi:hypothetical protein
MNERNMEHWWNDIDRGKPKYLEKNLPTATLSTTYSTWTDLGVNPGFCGRGWAYNHLIRGMALKLTFLITVYFWEA